jgi:hypothetical protein
MPQDIKCIVVQQKHMGDDYWTIERAAHDGRKWMQRLGPYSQAFCLSSRLGEPSADPKQHNNADVEGYGSEMLAIAHAIEHGLLHGPGPSAIASFTRCEARVTEDGVELMSPRNSRFPVTISHDNAKQLAADIRAKVTRTTP